MDEKAIKEQGVKPLRAILKQIIDMFPVDQSNSKSKKIDDLSEVMEYLQKLGVSGLVSAGVGADDKDPDTVVVQVSPPYRIGLPAKDYYADAAVVKKYEDTLTLVLENIYPDNGPAEDLAHVVVEFEKKLAASSPDAEDSNDVTVSLGMVIMIHES
jgi:endothelin-converting enzyme